MELFDRWRCQVWTDTVDAVDVNVVFLSFPPQFQFSRLCMYIWAWHFLVALATESERVSCPSTGGFNKPTVYFPLWLYSMCMKAWVQYIPVYISTCGFYLVLSLLWFLSMWVVVTIKVHPILAHNTAYLHNNRQTVLRNTLTISKLSYILSPIKSSLYCCKNL